jgi:hypothetical protein
MLETILVTGVPIMDFCAKTAQALSSVFTVGVRVRSAKIAKVWTTKTGDFGADIAYVDVSLGIDELNDKLIEVTVIAKVLPNAGRFLAIPDGVGGDDKRHPDYRLANDLRAMLTTQVFSNPEIAALADMAEAEIARRRSLKATPVEAKNPFLA